MTADSDWAPLPPDPFEPYVASSATVVSTTIRIDGDARLRPVPPWQPAGSVALPAMMAEPVCPPGQPAGASGSQVVIGGARRGGSTAREETAGADRLRQRFLHGAWLIPAATVLFFAAALVGFPFLGTARFALLLLVSLPVGCAWALAPRQGKWFLGAALLGYAAVMYDLCYG